MWQHLTGKCLEAFLVKNDQIMWHFCNYNGFLHPLKAI